MEVFLYNVTRDLLKISGLIIIVSLVSCGGGSDSGTGQVTTYSIGGNVSGLQGIVKLQNNGVDTVTISTSGAFAFNGELESSDSYSVIVISQPAGQSCSLNNTSGVVQASNVTTIVVTCVDVVSATLSGTYQAAPLTRVDSDINDPFAVANVSNNTSETAQLLPTFASVNGFATAIATGRTAELDRFASVADIDDFYRVSLQANQTLRLQVVDFSGEDTFTGDLDLYLYDLDLNLIAYSDTTTEFETITVPTSGDYYIRVSAWSGSSKYTLDLNTVSGASTSNQGAGEFVTGEAIVQFKTGVQVDNVVNSFNANNQQILLSHSEPARAMRMNFSGFNVNSAAVLTSKAVESTFTANLEQSNVTSYQKFQTLQKIKRLNQRADVEFAEPNYIVRAKQVPNDEFYGLQWHYPAINLPQAWDITIGTRIDSGADVIVAVVDTGVFLAHTEFSGQLVSGYDFISDISNAADGDGIDSNPDDPGDGAQLSSSSWHGTHVSGTVAANSNNSNGIAGVAWQAKIMPLRVLGVDGGSTYDTIQAIRFAAGLSNDSGTVPAQVADVINLSLGGYGFSQAEEDAFTAVRDAGVIVVAAAGNETTSLLSYPASYAGVISVSATDFANARAPYSNFGSMIDVAAPGGNQGADLNNDNEGDGVLSTLVDDSSGSRVSTYAFYQGTSMATPHMAGVVALMRAVYPSLTPVELDALLSAGVITTDLGSAGRDDTYGHGLIDALKAVSEAQKLENGGALPPQPALIVATPNQLTLGTSSAASLVLSNEGDATASISGVSDNASWLTITEDSVDANKLGDYQISIDRTGLADSSYLGTITFSLSTGSSLQVQVTMDVGDVDKIGETGTIYLLLIDSDDEIVAEVGSVNLGDGSYSYSFDGIDVGSYQIVGGSDVDNDMFLCQLAETCGGYPTIDALSTIEVVADDINNLDFVVDILSTFGSSNIAADGVVGTSGFMRDAKGNFTKPDLTKSIIR